MANKAIVLMNANDADNAKILQYSTGRNRVFGSVDAAFEWVENNARIEWVTKVIEID